MKNEACNFNCQFHGGANMPDGPGRLHLTNPCFLRTGLLCVH